LVGILVVSIDEVDVEGVFEVKIDEVIGID